MKTEDFESLLQSVREAGHIRRGERPAARETRFDPVDVAGLRLEMKLSQQEFAALLGVPVRTLRNWEQGRRTPRGPALALLSAVQKDPEHVLKALQA